MNNTEHLQTVARLSIEALSEMESLFIAINRELSGTGQVRTLVQLGQRLAEDAQHRIAAEAAEQPQGA